ncbi:MAG: hypothetical protein AAGU21_13940 [Solidesulfovibrio sp.]|uniref:hypothetical protein n=1 Tax=Solidesulfovibrio sp. TaxID=2910990 RepID=UPI0031593767
MSFLGGLSGFAAGLMDGADKAAERRYKAAQQAAEWARIDQQWAQMALQDQMRQAQMDQMQHQQARQDKADWQSDYDRGMKQIGNNYLNGVLTGQNPATPDVSVFGYMDPNVLAAIQQKNQDQIWTKGLMDAIGRATGGAGLMNGPGVATPPANPMTPQPGPTSDAGVTPPASPSSGTVGNSSQAPIWQRNSNPGNLRNVNGEGFQSFPDMQTGLNAMTSQLRRYQNTYGLNTVRGIVSRYAPSNENNTPLYISLVSNMLGRGPDDPLDLNDTQTAKGLTWAMAHVEGSGKALTDDMLNTAAGLGRSPGQPAGQVFAQNGPQVVSDASGNPRAPGMGGGQPNGNYWTNVATAVAPFVAAPGKAGDAAKNIIGMAKTMVDLTQPQYDIVERSDGTFMVDKRTGQYRKIEGLPGKDNGAAFSGQGMEQQAMSAVYALAPKIQAGTATDEEKSKYLLSETYLTQPKVTTDPATGAQTVMQLDLSQLGFPSLKPRAQMPTQPPQIQQSQGQTPGAPTSMGNGYVMTQTGDRKPLTAQETGKISGAQLSTGYVDEAEKRLFPNGNFDNKTALKMFLPHSDAVDVRNLLREAIGYGLYLKTGAQANEKEVDEQEKIYMPSPYDSPLVARSKLTRLRAFLGTALQNAGRGQVQQQQQAPGAWNQPSQPQANDPLGLR